MPQYRINYAQKRLEVVLADGTVTHVYILPGGDASGLPAGVQQMRVPPGVVALLERAVSGDTAAQSEATAFLMSVTQAYSQAASATTQGQAQSSGGQGGVGMTPAQYQQVNTNVNTALTTEVQRLEQEQAEAAERAAWAAAGFGEAPFDQSRIAPIARQIETAAIPQAWVNDPDYQAVFTQYGNIVNQTALAARRLELERVRQARGQRQVGAEKLTTLRGMKDTLQQLEADYNAQVARMATDPKNDAQLAAFAEDYRRKREQLEKQIRDAQMAMFPEDTQKYTIQQQYQEINGPGAAPPEGLDPLGWSYTYNEAKRVRGFAEGGIVPEVPPVFGGGSSMGATGLTGAGTELFKTRMSPEEQDTANQSAARNLSGDIASSNIAQRLAQAEQEHRQTMADIARQNQELDRQFTLQAQALQARARAAASENPFVAQLLGGASPPHGTVVPPLR